MLDFSGLNWWAILVATMAGFMLGGLWYGPIFGKAWLKAIGKTEDDIEPSPTPFIVSFFTSLITAIAVSALIHNLGFTTLSDGIALGVIAGIGFIATSMGSDSAFGRSGLPLFLIQSGYRVTYTIIMGAILVAWQ
jgi:uncharacterized membrane protein